MLISFSGGVHAFRSKGLFAFLGILRQAYPQWVDFASLLPSLPGVGPRQLARYVDSLEAAGLSLVDYETKTRGRYRLAVAPELVSFVGECVPDVMAPPQPSPLPLAETSLDVSLEPAWVRWVVALLHATLAEHEGEFSGAEGALANLEVAGAAANHLPLWTASVVFAHRAHVLARESRYREAAFWLRRVDTLVRQGQAHPATASRARLIRAKMRYDQARYDEAEYQLGLLPLRGDIHCPHRLNMQAQLAGRQFLTAGDEEAPGLLARTLSALLEALGHVFLGKGDSSLLDNLCYNIGRNMIRGVRRGIVPESCMDTAMQWLAANQLACRKLGIGDGSVLINLLLIDAGLDHGYSIDRWPPLLKHGLHTDGNLHCLLADSLAHARQAGNRLEIASCLRRQVRLAVSGSEAQSAYREAADLFTELGRRGDLVTLAEEWRKHFGGAPPARIRA